MVLRLSAAGEQVIQGCFRLQQLLTGRCPCSQNALTHRVNRTRQEAPHQAYNRASLVLPGKDRPALLIGLCIGFWRYGKLQHYSGLSLGESGQHHDFAIWQL